MPLRAPPATADRVNAFRKGQGMQLKFKTGDRVRSKQTGCLGTVVSVLDVGAGVSRDASIFRVEWDDCDGPPRSASADDIYAVRPPPVAWPATFSALAF
jgi:hypothetical protein